jgi:hypothetical protein
LIFEEDGTDVVDGNVDGVGDTRDGKDALECQLGIKEKGRMAYLG